MAARISTARLPVSVLDPGIREEVLRHGPENVARNRLCGRMGRRPTKKEIRALAMRLERLSDPQTPELSRFHC